jgi:hypothetical protein
VLESARTRIKVLVQEQDGDQMAEGQMEVEEASPHRVTRWNLRAIPRPPGYALARLTEAAALEAARARLDDLVRQGRVSGVLIITRQGKPLLSEVRGLRWPSWRSRGS